MSEGYRPGEPAYRRVAVALFLAGMATFALVHAPQPMLPELAIAFSLSPAEATLAVSATMFALGAALLITGPGTEVIGRTPVMFASLFISGTVALGCGLAPTWPTLVGLRTLQGLTLAGLPAVATAYLREEIHISATSRAVGLYIGGTAIGGMSGRLIAGTVTDLVGWRVAFIVLGAVTLTCAGIAWWLLPRSRHFHPVEARPKVILSNTIRALKDPVLLRLYGISGTLMGGFVAAYNSLGFRLTSPPYNLPLALASAVFLTYAVGTFAASTAGALADRHGHAKVLARSMVCALAGLAITAFTWLPVLIVGIVIFTAGFFAAHGVASALVAIRATETGNGPGQAAAMYLFAYYVGAAVLGGAAGLAWTVGQWPGVLLLAGGAWTLTWLLAALLPRRADTA